MDIKDLMIGDWVCFNNVVMTIGRLNPEFEDCENIEPIPLTKEILVDNGFGYIESDGVMNHFYLGEPHYCENMDLHIGNQGGSFWLNYKSNTIYGIRYVHELQHAFKICRINKEIEL